MNSSNWNYPTTVWFGEGRVKDLYLACKNLKIQKPLLVTDKDLGKSDLVKKITNDQNLKKLSSDEFIKDFKKDLKKELDKFKKLTIESFENELNIKVDTTSNEKN